MDAEGLALGCEIATSKKRARDLMDGSFHRCVFVCVSNFHVVKKFHKSSNKYVFFFFFFTVFCVN